MGTDLGFALAALAAMVVFGLAHVAWRGRSPVRTLIHWRGKGVRADLSPPEAAVLLGAHPGILVRLVG